MLHLVLGGCFKKSTCSNPPPYRYLDIYPKYVRVQLDCWDVVDFAPYVSVRPFISGVYTYSANLTFTEILKTDCVHKLWSVFDLDEIWAYRWYASLCGGYTGETRYGPCMKAVPCRGGGEGNFQPWGSEKWDFRHSEAKSACYMSHFFKIRFLTKSPHTKVNITGKSILTKLAGIPDKALHQATLPVH